MSSRLRISLVIPVYNEESHLAACLERAVGQRRHFDEIIVVDNNSTDATVAVAAQFPAVQVVHELRQGVVHARNRGFDTATGDIIARIDADTLLPADWAGKIAKLFADGTLDAVSGAITYHDVAGHHLVDPIDFRLRSWLARKMPRHMFLLGANMAIRRTSWQTVRQDLCIDSVHEDLDLAAHLGERQATVLFAPALLAGVSGRRIDTNFIDFLRYLHSLPDTYARHGLSEQRYMYPVAGIVLLHYLPLRVLFRGYDEEHRAFRASNLFAAQKPQRVNPVTFID